MYPTNRRTVLALLVSITTLTSSGCRSGSSGTDQPATNVSTVESAPKPLKVALVASMSGGSALAGQAIQRGIEVAIDELNSAGGLLGRPISLVVRDDEGSAPKGIAAVREVVESQGAVAVFGGLHSPVALAEVPVIQELRVPYLGTWAAATKIVRNGHDPNYVFRVSACDDFVDQFLIRRATELPCTSIGLILENTPWGESNEEGLRRWGEQGGRRIVGSEKFNWGDSDMTAQLMRLRDAGAECLIMVANAPEGGQVIRSKAKLGWPVPTLSHWGISGGRFTELAGDQADTVSFIQTFSFFGTLGEVGTRVLEALKKREGIKGPKDILAPVGTANAYDAMRLLATAIQQAGTTDGPKVQQALENIPELQGLIKMYHQPFTPTNHEALSEADYLLVRWEDGSIVPVDSPPAKDAAASVPGP